MQKRYSMLKISTNGERKERRRKKKRNKCHTLIGKVESVALMHVCFKWDGNTENRSHTYIYIK